MIYLEKKENSVVVVHDGDDVENIQVLHTAMQAFPKLRTLLISSVQTYVCKMGAQAVNEFIENTRHFYDTKPKDCNF